MLNWFKSRSLEERLHSTKKVKIEGIHFVIKKIDSFSFMDGSNSMTKHYDIYKVKSAEDVDVSMEKAKGHFRDVFMSSVVSPKLKRKESDPEGVLVDDLFNDWGLVNELYGEIIKHTYGKKKIQ